ALNEVLDFSKNISTYEIQSKLVLLVLLDGRSNAYYCECHILSKELIAKCDTDAVIDPELQEEFRANRELEPANLYFLQMVEDAKRGRTFSDIVIEYNTTYKETIPLKVLGGQHRTEAIRRAFLEDSLDKIHGVKVYFNLNKDQRADIMRISNTNISVSTDLRDRIEEERLEPSGMLRNFCYTTGLLKEEEDFGDKRRYDEDFTPTVRMLRSFIVNYFKGVNFNGDIDKAAEVPYLCKSGRGIDEEYLAIFNKFKSEANFTDNGLINAAKNFARLHETQYAKAEEIGGSVKRQYKLKAYNLATVASWAFAAGVLSKYPTRQKKLYALPDLCGKDDPLNAQGMAKAKHKSDLDTYRGLGTREDAKERGRLLYLWLNYSNSDKPKVTEQMCNAAIDIFHSNMDNIAAEEKRKRAF
ncbi:MAG: hypothetical protein ABSC20_11675, partial [Candidatus Bathyarchaeia archaeon]